MMWSNWQGAIWRGAMVVVLMGSGLAWAQGPTKMPAPANADRIMVVHENGKATRCRVLETWQLPDRRIAHLLQSLDSGEMITIVDDSAPPADAGDGKNVRGMAKRIFTWGAGRLNPPDGSPIPPHMRIDSGVVQKHENTLPSNATPTASKPAVKHVLDETALSAPPPSFPKQIVQTSQKEVAKPELPAIAELPAPPAIPAPVKPIVEAPKLPPVETAPVKPIVEAPKLPPVEAPKLPVVDSLPVAPLGETPRVPPVAAPKLPTLETAPAKPLVDAPKLPAVVESSVPLPAVPSAKDNPSALPAIPAPGDLKPKVNESTIDPKVGARPSTDPCPTKCEVISSTIIEPANRSWRPGDKLQAWLLNRSAPRMVETKTIEPALAQKHQPKSPFSTAVAPMPTPPLSIPSQPKVEQVAALPPLETPKAPLPEKRDMWGTSPTAALPGKSLADLTEKKIDPLLAPERITKIEEVKPKSNTVVSKLPPESPAPTMLPAARPTEQWPLNSQSILAANSGVQGPVVYVPYPVVTVPQPHRPPVPPAPKLPDAPQLNAYVNAFTPPPAPQGQPNPAPNGMMPQGNPMLAQQQMMQQQMMQQQMMQQQMMAQQRMMPQGNPMANNAPMMQAPPMLHQASHQQPMQAQPSTVAQQVDQLVRAMRESPYPSQREWAAQQLASLDCRANPQILQAIVLSAQHDPAVSVRAGCVYCLGRMQAPGEPVVAALQGMRNDAEPRVREQVEQALARLGQPSAGVR